MFHLLVISQWTLEHRSWEAVKTDWDVCTLWARPQRVADSFWTKEWHSVRVISIILTWWSCTWWIGSWRKRVIRTMRNSLGVMPSYSPCLLLTFGSGPIAHLLWKLCKRPFQRSDVFSAEEPPKDCTGLTLLQKISFSSNGWAFRFVLMNDPTYNWQKSFLFSCIPECDFWVLSSTTRTYLYPTTRSSWATFDINFGVCFLLPS